MKPIRCVVTALAICAASSACFAQSPPAGGYPSRPITLVVPFSPGGGSDSIARLFAAKLGEQLGQSVVIDNRAGAGGTIGTAAVARAVPDGQTLLLADTPFTANVSVYRKPGYAISDFAPIVRLASVPTIVVVGKNVPVDTLDGLIKLAQKQPGKVNMASGGVGGVAHLVAARFAAENKIEWAHVPYRGMSPAIVDVLGGQADVIFATAPSVMGHIKAGRLKALAITSAQRSKYFPNVPTMVELGHPALVSDNWYGIVAPAKTSAAVVQLLREKTEKILQQPDVREKLAELMAEPAAPTSSKDFGKLIDQEAQIWARTVKSANILAE
jgi:tripartite-type tricarboxylate transporter receptor subunit TctC